MEPTATSLKVEADFRLVYFGGDDSFRIRWDGEEGPELFTPSVMYAEIDMMDVYHSDCGKRLMSIPKALVDVCDSLFSFVDENYFLFAGQLTGKIFDWMEDKFSIKFDQRTGKITGVGAYLAAELKPDEIEKIVAEYLADKL